MPASRSPICGRQSRMLVQQIRPKHQQHGRRRCAHPAQQRAPRFGLSPCVGQGAAAVAIAGHLNILISFAIPPVPATDFGNIGKHSICTGSGRSHVFPLRSARATRRSSPARSEHGQRSVCAATWRLTWYARFISGQDCVSECLAPGDPSVLVRLAQRAVLWSFRTPFVELPPVRCRAKPCSLVVEVHEIRPNHAVPLYLSGRLP